MSPGHSIVISSHLYWHACEHWVWVSQIYIQLLFFFVGPVFKGHVVTISQLEWHMTIVIVWKLIGLLKIMTSCFCTGVPHCSQLHINPEMLKLNTIKFVNCYTVFWTISVSQAFCQMSVNVYMVFWTKYVTPSFINTDWVTQKFIIEREWHDFLLLETILNLDCCNFRPHI